MLVCCWFDLGLRLLKVENGTFENRTIAGNSHYLVPFGNRTIAGTTLIETALTGDPLYIVCWSRMKIGRSEGLDYVSQNGLIPS